MEIVYLIAGIVILLLVTMDVFWTTIWVDGGAGPLSSRLAKYGWKGMKKIAENRPKILSLSGPMILALTLLSWILLLWLGWLLVFAGGSESIVDTRDNMPIDWFERIYFTGYMVFTLGIGDYVPQDGPWQIVTAVATGNGMLFITLGVTYVLSILNAVTSQRAFASSITGGGETGSQLVRNAWNGENFHNIDLLLNSVSSQLSTLASQHKAYPILHYYHSMETAKAASIGVTVLDEALTLLEFGIPKNEQPNQLLIQETRSSIGGYLNAISPRMTGTASRVPPAPDFAYLQQQGLPTVSEEAFHAELDKLKERRTKLLTLIELDARPWPDGKSEWVKL